MGLRAPLGPLKEPLVAATEICPEVRGGTITKEKGWTYLLTIK